MMRLLLLLPACLAATPAAAIQRHTIDGMGCAEVRAILSREGSAILRYRSQRNPSLTLFDRFVADRRHCSLDEYAERSTVPVTDGNCTVNRCRQIELHDD